MILDEYQRARAAKLERRASKPIRYFSGVVASTSAGIAEVAAFASSVRCTIPSGITVSTGDTVRVRNRGCDYVVEAVL